MHRIFTESINKEEHLTLVDRLSIEGNMLVAFGQFIDDAGPEDIAFAYDTFEIFNNENVGTLRKAACRALGGYSPRYTNTSKEIEERTELIEQAVTFARSTTDPELLKAAAAAIQNATTEPTGEIWPDPPEPREETGDRVNRLDLTSDLSNRLCNVLNHGTDDDLRFLDQLTEFWDSAVALRKHPLTEATARVLAEVKTLHPSETEQPVSDQAPQATVG